MSIVLESKLKTQSTEKSPQHIAISQKHINIFLNERISSCIKGDILTSPNSSKINRMLSPAQRYLSIVSPSATFANQKPASPVSRKSTSSFRQMLKLSAARSSKNRAISMMVDREGASECGRSRRGFQVAMIHDQKRGLPYNPSDFLAVRKQIELKFERTKMILKEQTKMKRFQKIQQIYDKKFKDLSKNSHMDQQNRSRVVNSFPQNK